MPTRAVRFALPLRGMGHINIRKQVEAFYAPYIRVEYSSPDLRCGWASGNTCQVSEYAVAQSSQGSLLSEGRVFRDGRSVLERCAIGQSEYKLPQFQRSVASQHSDAKGSLVLRHASRTVCFRFGWVQTRSLRGGRLTIECNPRCGASVIGSSWLLPIRYAQ